MTVPPPLSVGLLGLGTVGSEVYRLLADRAAITARAGVPLAVTRVAVARATKSRSIEVPATILTSDAGAIVEAPEVDIVVELIGGLEPARSYILRAMERGKSVVTANKQVMAAHGTELLAKAQALRVDLCFEGSVGGGIPLIKPIRESLAAGRISRIMGILNGTTNYILTRMTEEGASYADALADAQSLGYAERDPTADVEGFDAGAKAAIIASIAFGVKVVAGDVYREGISGVTAADIAFAKRLGYVVKLLAIAEHLDGEVAVRVHPSMLPETHPLASVRDSFNAVFVEGEAVGELMFYGRGAGGMPTASAVLGDLVDAAHNLRAGGSGRTSPLGKAAIRPIDELSSQYYLDLTVDDRPGVLAAVATVFGGHGVSIRSMEQFGMGAEARLVFITHTARERDMQATIHDLRKLPPVERIGSLLRVIGPE